MSNEIRSSPIHIYALARTDLQGHASGHTGAPGSGPVSKGIFKDLSAMDLLFNCGPYSRRILEQAQKQGRVVT
ncbi:MAG: hypothetical protein U9N58_05460 [Thermodesulfobacteriota bacterium]|nr:hypothetical protein [Thermodesulfobacteriota bacterium]